MALADKSLLHRAADPSAMLPSSALPSTALGAGGAGGRYEIHDLLRQYAAEKLAASPDAEQAVRDRHGATYAAALERWAAALKGPRQQAALAEIEAEAENARTAWKWAVEHGQAELLDQAMEGLGLFYEWRARYQEGQTAFRAAAEALAPAEEALPAPVEDLRARVKALTWQSLFGSLLGHTDQARQLLGCGLDLLDGSSLADQDVRPERAFALRVVGEIIDWSGNRREAREPYAQSLALYRALGDRWGTANTLCALAQTVHSLGDFHEARRLYQEALALRRALDDPRGTAESLSRVAWVLQSLGQFEQAERLERESVAICREMGDRDALADGLWRLASTLNWNGRFSEGHSLAEECLAIRSDLGTYHQDYANLGLGIAKTSLGWYREARACLQRALALAREVDNRWATGATLFVLDVLAFAEEKYVEAQQWLQESVLVHRRGGQRSDVGWPLAVLGGAEGRLGRFDQAREHLCEALRITAEIQDALTPRIALPAAALLLADLGQAEWAVEIYALASRYPFVANSRSWEDVAGKHIAALAATLSPDVVAAAQERGRARDLWATVEELLAELEDA